MTQILYCLRNPAQRLQLQALCKQSGLSARAFQAVDASKAVLTLLQPGMHVKKAAGSLAPMLWQAPEFILMSGLQGLQMERFLNACEEIGISRDVLKAVVTPVNASWTLYTLLSQLQKEHNMLNRG